MLEPSKPVGRLESQPAAHNRAAGAFWRRLAYAGARHGPEAWLRLSPPLFGLAFAAALGSHRRNVRDNVRRALGRHGPLEESWYVAKTFVSYASCLAESLASERPEVAHARRRMRHPQRIRAALSGGPLIIGTAHFGAWDVAAPLLASDLGAPVLVAMRPEADPSARALHDDVRERAGVRVVHVGSHPLDALPLLHHLRDGGIVALQLDRVTPGSRQLEVSLFDAPYRMPAGPFLLSALAQVPILPVFVRRRGYLDYELSAGALLRLGRRPDEAELVSAAQAAATEMERAIYACPSQWFHFEQD